MSSGGGAEVFEDAREEVRRRRLGPQGLSDPVYDLLELRFVDEFGTKLFCKDILDQRSAKLAIVNGVDRSQGLQGFKAGRGPDRGRSLLVAPRRHRSRALEQPLAQKEDEPISVGNRIQSKSP